MSVSDSVRMALNKGSKSQTDLSKFWGTSLQVISNKIRLERWTGEELARIAEYTGGKLAFVYPEGTQIMINGREDADRQPDT